VKRCLSYNVIQLVHMINTNYKKYKSYNDLANLDNKPGPEYRTKYVSPVIMPPKECVSYGVFLQKYPNASKKTAGRSHKTFL
jgi:hypothetical protein